MSNIGILDLGMGNLHSVANAIYQLGYDPVTATAGPFDAFSHLIIPGVGQFATAMANLHARDLYSAIYGYAASGRPLLGICLGMHLLATSGTEGGLTGGLGLVPGRVDRLAVPEAIRIPHVGWNTVNQRRAHPLLAGIKPGRDFYFVHSYAFRCDEASDVLTDTDYGAVFTSAVARRNVAGFQFHPEKSQANGLKLLDNFCRWNGQC